LAHAENNLAKQLNTEKQMWSHIVPLPNTFDFPRFFSRTHPPATKNDQFVSKGVQACTGSGATQPKLKLHPAHKQGAPFTFRMVQ
jgi:hypothetical protein